MYLRMMAAKDGIAYTPATSMRTFAELLYNAMVKMKFLYAEMVDKKKFSEHGWKNHLENLAADWRKADHNLLTVFITEGSYESLKEKVMGKGLGMGKESLKISTPGGEIELDLEDVEAEVVKAKVARSQLSPKHELEEILTEVAWKADPRYGVW